MRGNPLGVVQCQRTRLAVVERVRSLHACLVVQCVQENSVRLWQRFVRVRPWWLLQAARAPPLLQAQLTDAAGAGPGAAPGAAGVHAATIVLNRPSFRTCRRDSCSAMVTPPDIARGPDCWQSYPYGGAESVCKVTAAGSHRLEQCVDLGQLRGGQRPIRALGVRQELVGARRTRDDGADLPGGPAARRGPARRWCARGRQPMLRASPACRNWRPSCRPGRRGSTRRASRQGPGRRGVYLPVRKPPARGK